MVEVLDYIFLRLGFSVDSVWNQLRGALWVFWPFWGRGFLYKHKK